MTSARLLSSLHLVLIEHCHTLQSILVCELHLIVHYHGSILHKLWHPNLHHLRTNIMMHKLKMVLPSYNNKTIPPMYASHSFRIPCLWSFRAFFESSHATQLLHDLAQYLYTQDNETWQPFAKEDVKKCCLLSNVQSPTMHSILMNTFTFVLFSFLAQWKKFIAKRKKQQQTCTNTSIFWHQGLSLSAPPAAMVMDVSKNVLDTLTQQTPTFTCNMSQRAHICSFMRFA
jgi:hypothetical protein